MPSTEQVVLSIRDQHARLPLLIGGLTDEQARHPSQLPGWSRGHVLTHLANHSRAVLRQLDHAARGEVVAFYAGGAVARNAGIEAGAGRPATELVADLLEANAEVDAALPGFDATLPCGYRDGTVAGLIEGRWRENALHADDLGLAEHSPWPADLCVNVLDFLVPRLPAGVSLRATDSEWSWGGRAPTLLEGSLDDLATWISGRAGGRPPTVVTGELPELGPWP